MSESVWDGYGSVRDVDRAGMDKADEDALECLLALCRIMGIRYDIHLSNPAKGWYTIKVSWTDWPTDFYAPCRRDGCRTTLCVTHVVRSLRSTVVAAVSQLRSNAEQFSASFKRYWLERTGCEWGQ